MLHTLELNTYLTEHMINWQLTKEKFGHGKECLAIKRPKVVVNCDSCSRSADYTIRVKAKIKNDNVSWFCPKCVGNRPEVKKSLSIAKQNADNLGISPNPPKMTKDIKDKISQSANCYWENNNELKTEYSKKYSKNPKYFGITKADKDVAQISHISRNYGDLISKKSKNNWKDKKYIDKTKSKLNIAMNKLRSNENYNNMMIKTRINQLTHTSSIQKTLYSILDDLNLKYHKENDNIIDKECVIGPYTFDCVIPRENSKTLLIECQGDYWHSFEKRIKLDQSKLSYIENNFSDKYELKYLWEHEFKCKDKIVETIKYWMGITKINVIDYDFKDVMIKLCPSKDYKLLLSKYHYLSNAGRGGIAYGAYLDDILIGVCIFSSLIRQNINIDGYEQKEVRELSRLCIHPAYQKQNLASWFISRCVKQLDIKYKCIISYCDTTFNHDGATYKACNFKQDSVVPSDYWYIDKDGWVMHKKTLYDHAIKMGMKESEYATKFDYTKIYGKEKLRFVYKRDK